MTQGSHGLSRAALTPDLFVLTQRLFNFIGAVMSNLHSFQSWSEVYQALRAKAEATRGTVTIKTNGEPGATFPHTSAGDAFTITLVFDAAVNDYAAGAVVGRWIIETDLLAGEPEDCQGPYVGNRSFWETLAVAVVELDRVQAPLPGRSLIDDAMKQLETARTASGDPVRNAAGSMLVTVFSERSWKAMALRQFEFFRALRGESGGANPFMPRVPATRNADVLALAVYWTDQLARVGDNATDTYHRLVYSCWREVMGQVERYAKHAPDADTYPLNAEFWTALLLLTTQSDACGAPPTPWAFHVHPTRHRPRNVAAVDTGATLDFPAAKTWDEAAKMQRDAFAQLRGEDAITGRLIGRVPRTTIADVRQLAAYWQNGLARVGERHWADISSRHVIERWKAAVAEVDRIPLNADPNAVYARNVDFWEALITIAIQVAVTNEAPTRWQLVKEATKQAIADLPHTLKTAAEDFVTGVIKRPLTYLGVGLGGLAVILLLTRSRKSESKNEHQP